MMVMLGDVGQNCDDGCDDSAEGIPLVRIGQMVVDEQRGGTEGVNYVSPSRLLRMSGKMGGETSLLHPKFTGPLPIMASTFPLLVPVLQTV